MKAPYAVAETSKHPALLPLLVKHGGRAVAAHMAVATVAAVCEQQQEVTDQPFSSKAAAALKTAPEKIVKCTNSAAHRQQQGYRQNNSPGGQETQPLLS